MAGVNKVILLGVLGRDPEIRYTPEGTAVSIFSIATSDKWRDKTNGKITEKTEWHRVIAWHKLAEMCEKYLFKGYQVYVEGKLKTRSWKKNRVFYYITEIIATYVHLICSKCLV